MLDQLPIDMLKEIFLHTSIKELISHAGIAKKYRDVIRDFVKEPKNLLSILNHSTPHEIALFTQHVKREQHHRDSIFYTSIVKIKQGNMTHPLDNVYDALLCDDITLLSVEKLETAKLYCIENNFNHLVDSIAAIIAVKQFDATISTEIHLPTNCYLNLPHADLTKANLAGQDLSDANLEFCKLNNAILRKTQFNQARLNKSEIKNTDLSHAKFDKAQLEHADLHQSFGFNPHFDNANLHYAKFKFTNFTEPVFINANLDDAKLVSASLTDADFTNATLRRTKLTHTNFSYANFMNSILPIPLLINDYIDFSHANFSHTIMIETFSLDDNNDLSMKQLLTSLQEKIGKHPQHQSLKQALVKNIITLGTATNLSDENRQKIFVIAYHHSIFARERPSLQTTSINLLAHSLFGAKRDLFESEFQKQLTVLLEKQSTHQYQHNSK